MEFVTLVETEVVAASVENVQLLEVVATEIIGDDVTVIETVDVEVVEVLTDRLVQLEIVEVSGQQGPPGPPGVSEEEMPYAERVNFVGDTLIYRGYAAVGTPTATAAWRVKRITLSTDGDAVIEWAGGTANFDKVWDDHLSESYS